MRVTTFATMLLTFAAATATAQGARAHAGTEPQLNWGPAPANFPPGAQLAVLQGDPAGTGLFTVRLKKPNVYKVPPHTHPTAEHVTVISGDFAVGMGKTFETKGMLTLSPGGFVTAPANEAHYALARGVTVVQIHAIAPFSVTYVNAADAPQSATRR
jgi:mannose-6-phosphate isomerase-like protein (cupin superfamily)